MQNANTLYFSCAFSPLLLIVQVLCGDEYKMLLFINWRHIQVKLFTEFSLFVQVKFVEFTESMQSCTPVYSKRRN